MDKREKLWNVIRQGIHDMVFVWRKEMRTLIHDEGIVIFFILVPLFYPLLYSWAYNNETVHEVPVAIVDMSHSSLSREFIRHYDASPHVKVKYFCNSLEEAKKLIGKQEVYGIIYIPSDFSTNLNRMQQAHVSVYCNMGFVLYYKAIYQTAMLVSMDMNSNIQVSWQHHYTDHEDQLLTEPLAYEEVPLYNPQGGYGSFIIPGVLILVIQQTLLLGIGLSAGSARENNAHRELVPLSEHYHGIFRIVLGKSACYFMVYAILGAYEMLIVPRIFNFVHIGDSLTLMLIMLPFILSCIFFGMIFSCIVRYRENVMLLIVFTSVPFLFLTGLSWPQSNIPGIWQGISWLIPSTFGVRAFVRVNSMGATIADVLPEYIYLWIQVLVYFFIACLVYRRQIILSRKQFEKMRQNEMAEAPAI